MARKRREEGRINGAFSNRIPDGLRSPPSFLPSFLPVVFTRSYDNLLKEKDWRSLFRRQRLTRRSMAMEMRERGKIASLSNCFIQKSLSFSIEFKRFSRHARQLPSSFEKEDFIQDLRCNLMKTIYLVMAGHDNVPMNGIYVQMPILSCQFYLYPRHFLLRHPPSHPLSFSVHVNGKE